MALLLLTHPQPPAPFAAAFAELAPQETVFQSLEEAIAHAEDVEAVLLWRLLPGQLAPFTRLKLLCASAGGVDKIMACSDRPAQVPVTRTVDAAQNQQIAQYVVSHTLRHVRQQALFAAQAQRREWLRHPTPVPQAVRIGLLGLGESAQAVARSLQPLGFNVMGWSRSGRAVSGVESFHGAEGLRRMLAQSQVLVCLLPLTPQTEHIINADMLAQLPQGAHVINVARGGLLQEADLLAAVRSGHVAGATLDVQSREPLPADDPLWDLPEKILITPHIASLPNATTVVEQVLENLQRVRAGLPPLRQVDVQRGY